MYQKVVLVVLVLIFCWQAHAQSSLGEQERALVNTRSELADLNSDVEDLEAQLDYFEETLIAASADLESAQQDAKQKQQELLNHKISENKDPSEANTRAVKQAEHSAKMAERGISTAERRVARLTRKRESVREELRGLYQQVAASETRIDALQSSIDRLRSQPEPSPEPAPEPAPQTVVANDVPLPVQSVQPEPSEEAEPEPAQAPAVVTQETATAEPPATALALATPAQSSVDAPADDTEGDLPVPNVRELDDIQDAMDRLAARLSRSPGRPIFSRLLLQMKNMTPVELEHLGSNQYLVYVALPAGEHDLSIRDRRFSYTVEEQKDGVEYVVLYDAKRPSRPKLHVFPRYYLQYVEAPIE